MFEPVNYLAILVAAVAHFIVGAIWYTALFGKKWMALQNIDEAKMKEMAKGAPIAYVGSFIGSIILAYATARLIGLVNPVDLASAFMLGILVWGGYWLIVDLHGSLYEKKPWALFFINTLYGLVGILAVTAILFYWR